MIVWRWVQAQAARFWRFLELNEKQLKAFFGLLALVLSLVTVSGVFIGFMVTNYQSQKKTAVEYVTRYSTGDLLAAQLKLTQFWLDDRNYCAWQALSGEEKEQHFLDVVRNEGFEVDVMKLFIFYNDLIVCANAGVCDRKTVCDMFVPDVAAFRSTYYDFIDDWQKKVDRDIVSGYEGFLTETCRKQFRAYIDLRAGERFRCPEL